MLALITMNYQCVHPIFCASAIPTAKYHPNVYFKFVEDLYSYSSVFSPLSVISFLFGRWWQCREMVKYRCSGACLRSYAIKYWMENSGLLPPCCWLTYLSRWTHLPQFKATKYFHGDLKDCHHLTKADGGKFHRNRKQEKKFSILSSAKTYHDFSSSAASELRMSILLYFKKIWMSLLLV